MAGFGSNRIHDVTHRESVKLNGVPAGLALRFVELFLEDVCIADGASTGGALSLAVDVSGSRRQRQGIKCW
jgi:hypothetical protein